MTSDSHPKQPELELPIARACPFSPPPEYGRLREHAPVSRVRLPLRQEAWAVTTFDEVRAMLVRPDVSSDPTADGFPDPYPDPEAAAGGVDDADDDELPDLLDMDPPQHTFYRRMLIPEFTVRRVNELRPAIQSIVDELIDDMLARGPGADLVTAYSLAIPSTVICHLLGIPYDSHRFFQTRTETIVSTTAGEHERAEAYGQLWEFLDQIVTDREAQPTDDVLGRLVRKHRRNGHLSHQMLVKMAVLLLLAGHETTANTISLGVLTLLRDPDQSQMLIDDPAAAAAAPDEVVRFHSLADVDISRRATADFELGGQEIRAGDGLIAIISAANHDPAAFERPDDFDIGRPDVRRHVGFGYGPHQCLGQNLARAELEIAYHTLFMRLPTLRVAVPLEQIRFKTDSQIFGVHSLPVTW